MADNSPEQELSSFLAKSLEENQRDWVYIFDFFFIDFPPLPKETFGDWKGRLDNKCSDYIEKICNEYSRHNRDRGLSISESNFNAILKSFNNQLNGKFAPIPHSIRFPLPILLNDFSRYPLGRLLKEKRRPTNWALNLSVYELSQAELKDMEIARLLFGIKKSTERFPKKHSVLSQISNIKKAVQATVSQAYPLP